MQPKVRIIFIRYKLPEIEEKAINLIKEYTKYPYELIDHDNGAKNENLSYLWNKYTKEFSGDWICLLNNDVFVREGWLENLMKVALTYPNVGIVGPSTDFTSSIQHTINTPELAKEHKGEVASVIDLTGFCYIYSKKVWEKVDGFDEDFKFYGQEQAFNRKVKYHGYKLYWVKGVFVNHLHSESARQAEARGEFNYLEARKQGTNDFNSWKEKTNNKYM
jgi:GT2 family glycosyltransferase